MYVIGSYAVPQIKSVNPDMNIDSFVFPASNNAEENILNSGNDLQFSIMEHYFKKLQEAMRKNWNRPALCNWQGEEFTFGELATRIERFHIVFGAAGISKGDKIALCARNSARSSTVIVPVFSAA